VKLLRLKADGFGPLRGEYRLATDRATLLVDDNERGKSSLLAAVHAALYGLEDDRRSHRLITPLERWRPWDGGTFRIELELERHDERYTIIRDFDRGTTEVWNHRGQELSHQFGEAQSVGRWLLGLDSEEFERCAFVRQGEIERVVEDEERMRRSSTLRARLEAAADSKSGDSTAVDALRALEQAAAKYTCPELSATVKVETAIDRLEGKCRLLEAELHELEHEFEASSQPLEELAALADEEKAARRRLTEADRERHALRARGSLDRLARDEALGREIATLRAEAAELESLSGIPSGADIELRQAVARLEEANVRLEGYETRAKAAEEERARLEGEVEQFARYAECGPDDADLCASHARELERIDLKREELEETLSRRYREFGARGLDEERIESLTERFSALDDEGTAMLRSQPHLILVFERSYSESEKARAESAERLHDIAVQRRRRSVPGWIALAAGSAAGGAGIAAFVLGMRSAWPLLLPIGAGLAVVGTVLLLSSVFARRKEREEALDRLSEADAHIEQLTRQRTENEARLDELARTLECEDSGDLMRDWSDYARFLADGEPLRQARQQIADLERRRDEIVEELLPIVNRTSADPEDPQTLVEAADGIRGRIEAERRASQFAMGMQWVEIEHLTARTSVDELTEQASQILKSAGLEYDAGQPWEPQIEAVAERVKASRRRAWLLEERIPDLERQRLDDATREHLRVQTVAVKEASGGDTPRSIDAVDAEIHGIHERIQQILQHRGDLRVAVDEISRRYDAQHTAKQTELERYRVALVRAQRFRDAVLLARETLSQVAEDTHRRWADFLNKRVGEILGTLGPKLGDLRFGEDLDFALRLADRSPVSRGRAVLQLSAGARDQLHLAVRLAISEYLSRDDEPLPLLVDDCFATSDDERTRAGMRLLIEHFAHKHQILFVTCHRRRYAELASLDPELYDRRVNWVELRTSPVG